MNVPDSLKPGSKHETFYQAYRPRDGFSSLPELALDNDTEKTGGSCRKDVHPSEEKEKVEDFGPEVLFPPISANSGRNTVDPSQEHSSTEVVTDPHDAPKSRFPILIRFFSAAFVLFLVLGIALGVGLGVGLKRNSHKVDLAISTYVNSRGAFNGTGLAVIPRWHPLNLTSDQPVEEPPEDGNLLLFFQHHSGQIRWMRRVLPNTWQGGSESEIVAVDAKNGTPISAQALDSNGLSQRHVFYIDNENVLRQKTIDNHTYVWTDGKLNDMNIKALDADKVGMQAYYYVTDSASNVNGGAPSEGLLKGIQLFVAASATTFYQLSWITGQSGWSLEQSPRQDLNAHASPTCFGWGVGQVFYALFVDPQDAVQLWWRDEAFKNIDIHPVGTWTRDKTGQANSNVAPQVFTPNVNHATSLSFDGVLYAELPDGTIHGWNVTFEAENSTLVPNPLAIVNGDPGVIGTHLLTLARIGIDTEKVTVFYQTHGDDITS